YTSGHLMSARRRGRNAEIYALLLLLSPFCKLQTWIFNKSVSCILCFSFSPRRRAHLRLCLERLKSLVPLGPDANRHTTLSLLMKAKDHIKVCVCVQVGGETRMDSTGSTRSSEKSDSDQEYLDVDVEGTDYLLGDLEWSTSSVSDSGDERGSLAQASCSDEAYSSASLQRLQDTQEMVKQLGCSL
uniref:MAX dimerization protein 1 n=1 Tax=Salarias fasciatus TaxID=181472 RepID=A0A672GA15_SALFA